MIIKGKQIKAVGDGMSLSIGDIQVAGNNRSAEYSFMRGNQECGHFTFTVLPNMSSLLALSLDYSGVFVNKTNIELKKERFECPDGFTERMGGIIYAKEEGKKATSSLSMEDNYYEDGQLIGKLRSYTEQEKISLLKLEKWSYDAINWKGNNYYFYPLKVDKKYCYCCHLNGNLVALIILERNLFSTDQNSSYDIYAYNDVDSDLLCVMAARFDYTYFENLSRKKQNQSTRSDFNFDGAQSKILASKYDPNFVNKIVSMENNGNQ